MMKMITMMTNRISTFMSRIRALSPLNTLHDGSYINYIEMTFALVEFMCVCVFTLEGVICVFSNFSFNKTNERASRALV